ncbi:hypothetical protein [Kineococcus sp. SYSU DK006]|uniref:hypothetical protein n=1 Tax=Kineococcus sp. SYSU DK006 TaxID=3383127 RepID=UPI003D7E37FD
MGTPPQFPTAAEALEWQVHELAGRVRRLTGGETAERSRWIVPVVQRLVDQPVLRRTRSGNWLDYDDVDRFALRRGRRLLPEDLDLRIAEHAQEVLRLLSHAQHPATVPLQVGVPGHLDVALFASGPAGVPLARGAVPGVRAPALLQRGRRAPDGPRLPRTAAGPHRGRGGSGQTASTWRPPAVWDGAHRPRRKPRCGRVVRLLDA